MGLIVRSLEKSGPLVSSSDSRQFHSGCVVLESGKEVGEHETGGGEELIVFIEGTAEVSDGGKAETVHAPAVVLVPAHTSHNVMNKSKARLRYAYIYNVAMDGS
jgi:mannose-6-phosphate isomerase-like protein (cupin superfamily)